VIRQTGAILGEGWPEIVFWEGSPIPDHFRFNKYFGVRGCGAQKAGQAARRPQDHTLLTILFGSGCGLSFHNLQTE